MLCVHWITVVKTTRVCEEMVKTAIILMRGLIPLLSPHISLKISNTYQYGPTRYGVYDSTSQPQNSADPLR